MVQRLTTVALAYSLGAVMCVGCGSSNEAGAPPVTSAADAAATPPANSKWTAENQQKYHEAQQNSRAGVEASGPAVTPGPTYSTDNPDDPVPPTTGGGMASSGGGTTATGSSTTSAGTSDRDTKASDGSGVVIGK
ncbi:MAG: hypothetical protein ABL949_00970 [Fimbriimonadaceae bacterium]